MLDDTFKGYVRNLVLPKFGECAERAKGNYSKRSSDLALKGHYRSGATFTAWHEARSNEKEEQITVVWEVIREVLVALHVPYSDSLADDLKAELDEYASYKMSGVPQVNIRQGDEQLVRQLQDDFEAKRTRALNKTKAEIDLFVASLRTVPQVEAKELDQNFKILLSRNQALKDFEKWMKELKGKNQAIAMLFIDIDHFKLMNEKHTHTTIDRTLFPEFMAIIRDRAKFRGEGYKYGGEEFIIILPNHDSVEAGLFAEKLRSSIAEHQFHIDDKIQTLTVSIGIAVWPQHGSSYAEIQQKANDAEAKAKLRRNTVIMAE